MPVRPRAYWDALAQAFMDAYATGGPDAFEHIDRELRSDRPLAPQRSPGMLAEFRKEVEATGVAAALADPDVLPVEAARRLVAGLRGFDSWDGLLEG